MRRRLNSHVDSGFGIFTTHAKDSVPSRGPSDPNSCTRDTPTAPPASTPCKCPDRLPVLTSPSLYLPAPGRALVNGLPEIFRSRPVEQNLSRVFSALLQSEPVTAFTYARCLFLESASICPQHVQLGQVNVSATLAFTRACATVAQSTGRVQDAY